MAFGDVMWTWCDVKWINQTYVNVSMLIQILNPTSLKCHSIKMRLHKHHLKTLATRLLVQQPVQAYMEENIKMHITGL